MSGARCAERASEAGARERTNKVSGRLITAILFGSAARRCSWENRIFCYQMTVRLRRFVPNPSLFEDSRRCFSCGVRELKLNVRSPGMQLKAFRTRAVSATVSESRRDRDLCLSSLATSSLGPKFFQRLCESLGAGIAGLLLVRSLRRP